MFGQLKVGSDAVSRLDDVLGILAGFDHGQFINGLRIVGYRTEAVHRDGDGAHAQKTEGHQTERKDRRRKGECRGHQRHNGRILGNHVRDKHQKHNHHSQPETGEVPRDETGQDVQRRPALFGSVDDFFAVTGRGAGEDFGEFGNQRAGNGSAADDHRQSPPQVCVFGIKVICVQQEITCRKGNADGNDRGNPDQVGQRMLEIEFFLSGKSSGADAVVDKVGNQRRQDHEDSHGENPDDQLAAHFGVAGQSQCQEGDQRDAGNAVSFKTIRRGADAVTRVVARTVGDDAGVFRVVFGKMEDDLHEVGTDVGDLREDTAADTQRGSAQRFTDRETDETGADQFFRDITQDHDHEEQFDAHQQKADAHAGTQADIDDVEGIAGKRRESSAGVGNRINADTEPGHRVGAQNTQNRTDQDDHDFAGRHSGQTAKIVNHTNGNQDP